MHRQQEHRTRRRQLIGVICLSLTLLSPSSVRAQEMADAPEDSVADMQRLLQKKKVDVERMRRMIESLNQIDSVYRPEYPTWTVLDLDLRERIRRAFRLRNLEVSPDADVIVITNPRNAEILEISIGDARMGRVDAYTYLSDSLQARILAGDYARQLTDLRPKKEEFGTLYGTAPRFAAAYASAFGAGLLFSNGWGVEGKMGFEEIGYHFWSTGSFRFLAVFDHLKIGAMVPIANGGEGSKRPAPLSIRPRKMTGAIGFTSDLELPFNSESVNAHLSVGDVTHVKNYRLLTDSTNIYVLHTVAQISYSRVFELSKGNDITLTGGLGYHQIAHSIVQPDLDVVTTEKEDFISPVIRLEYVSKVSNMFGITGQVYNSIAYLKGWVELFPNLLFLELQYYAPVFRDPKPWEQPYFFMVSPRIQVVY